MSETEFHSEELADERYTYQVDEEQSVSEAVTHAVAAISGREMSTAKATNENEVLDPLYDSIDPDALDALFQMPTDGDSLQGLVTFWYCGYEITVHNTGLIEVTDM